MELLPGEEQSLVEFLDGLVEDVVPRVGLDEAREYFDGGLLGEELEEGEVSAEGEVAEGLEELGLFDAEGAVLLASLEALDESVLEGDEVEEEVEAGCELAEEFLGGDVGGGLGLLGRRE